MIDVDWLSIILIHRVKGRVEFGVYLFRHINVLWLSILLDAFHRIAEAHRTTMNFVLEIGRITSLFTFVLDDIDYGSHHATLGVWVWEIGLWGSGLKEGLFQHRMILCKIFIQPDFYLSLIIDANHARCDLEWTSLIVEIIEAFKALPKDVDRLRENDLWVGGPSCWYSFS